MCHSTFTESTWGVPINQRLLGCRRRVRNSIGLGRGGRWPYMLDVVDQNTRSRDPETHGESLIGDNRGSIRTPRLNFRSACPLVDIGKNRTLLHRVLESQLIKTYIVYCVVLARSH
jgi:hypothetical protein